MNKTYTRTTAKTAIQNHCIPHNRSDVLCIIFFLFTFCGAYITIGIEEEKEKQQFFFFNKLIQTRACALFTANISVNCNTMHTLSHWDRETLPALFLRWLNRSTSELIDRKIIRVKKRFFNRLELQMEGKILNHQLH